MQHHQRPMRPYPLAALLLLLATLILPPTAALAEDDKAATANDHLLQAEIALKRDDYLAAAREYGMAAELSDDIEVARQATRVAYSYGFTEEALSAAKRWRSLDKNDEEAMLYIAQLQLRLGNIKASRASFKLLIESDGENPEERLISLVSILSQEDPEDAEAIMIWLAKPL